MNIDTQISPVLTRNTGKPEIKLKAGERDSLDFAKEHKGLETSDSSAVDDNETAETELGTQSVLHVDSPQKLVHQDPSINFRGPAGTDTKTGATAQADPTLQVAEATTFSPGRPQISQTELGDQDALATSTGKNSQPVETGRHNQTITAANIQAAGQESTQSETDTKLQPLGDVAQKKISGNTAGEENHTSLQNQTKPATLADPPGTNTSARPNMNIGAGADNSENSDGKSANSHRIEAATAATTKHAAEGIVLRPQTQNPETDLRMFAELSIKETQDEPEALFARTSTPGTMIAPGSATQSSTVLPERTVQIIAQAAIALKDRPIELTLNPEELGRVRLTMRSSEAGMSVSIAVERPETLDLLRKNIDQFAAQLRDIGYSDISFEFTGQSGEFFDTDAEEGHRPPPPTIDAEPASHELRTPHLRLVLDPQNGIDIRL